MTSRSGFTKMCAKCKTGHHLQCHSLTCLCVKCEARANSEGPSLKNHHVAPLAKVTLNATKTAPRTAAAAFVRRSPGVIMGEI